MKPAPFRYQAPGSLGEALSGLAEHGYEAKLLAGGQSLVPLMNFRLANPAVLIDLNRVPDLDYVLPSRGLKVIGCGVFWPASDETGHELTDASDHHLVWVDIEWPATAPRVR